MERTKPKLKVVESASKDITMLIRRDIEKRDWSACHLAGDKAKAVDLSTSRKWK